MNAVSTQLTLFGPETGADAPKRVDVSSTFQENTRLPIHRWFRFSAGFSARWAEDVIRGARAARVLDPFAGSGTTILAAEDAGADAIGIEAHPFLYRIASAKLLRRTSPDGYLDLIRRVRSAAFASSGSVVGYPPLVRKCYPPDTLRDLDALRKSLESCRDDSPAWTLAWLTLVCILRTASPVGTAQWQYVLPRKTKKHAPSPFAAFDAMSRMVAEDLRWCGQRPRGRGRIVMGDARQCTGVPDRYAELVLTSPPYPNNYDYADATRLEMCFFGEIRGWGDLQQAVRTHLIRACSQHVPERSVRLADLMESPEITPIRDDISRVCGELAAVREHKGGRKTYHLMVAAYFHDLARVWRSLRRVCAPKARVCFVIGDSAPYGVYVPVVDWLGALALAAGFRAFSFERTRDRNVKWKNRKHRVPLCEGRLWVEG